MGNNGPTGSYDNAGKTTGAVDKPTPVNSLMWRAFYYGFAWWIMAAGIAPGPGFFVSMILFALPLLFEYAKFVPDTKRRVELWILGMVVAFVWIVVGFTGLTGGFVIEQINGEMYVKVVNFLAFHKGTTPLRWFWWAMVASVSITCYDWLSYESPFERLQTSRSGVPAPGSDA